MSRNRKGRSKGDWSKSKAGAPNRKDGNTSSGNDMERDDRGRNARGENDVSWYTRYPNLVVASASLPYPYRPGMSVQIGNYNGNSDFSGVASPVYQKIPGVMSMIWAPTVGQSTNAMDPASLLGMEIYAKVREAYSGTLRADAPDYVIYIMALDSVFSYIGWLKRLYRVLNSWTPENYAMPAQILHGMGLMDDDIAALRMERMQLWEYINLLVLESRKFTCPGSLDIINRHYWMNDNVYVDDPTLNSQMFMFNMVGCYQYFLGSYGGESDQVGGLQFNLLPWVRSSTEPNPNGVGPTLSAKLLYDFGHQMLTSLAEWDDSYTINGYLKRAYGDVSLFVVDELPINAIFEPVFSTEVLSQIENSKTVIGGENISYVNYNFDIWQNPKTNAVVSKPSISLKDQAVINIDPWGSLKLAGSTPFLSSRNPNPGPLDNIIMTRLTAVSYVKTNPGHTSAKADLTVTFDVATEIPLTWFVVGFGSSSSYASSTENTIVDNIKNDAYHSYASTISTITFARIVGVVSQFDWHPFMVIGSLAQNEPYGAVFGDIHNVTSITPDMLKNIHQKCIYSEFNSFSMS